METTSRLPKAQGVGATVAGAPQEVRQRLANPMLVGLVPAPQEVRQRVANPSVPRAAVPGLRKNIHGPVQPRHRHRQSLQVSRSRTVA